LNNGVVAVVTLLVKEKTQQDERITWDNVIVGNQQVSRMATGKYVK
jgi:hypothetical protein